MMRLIVGALMLAGISSAACAQGIGPSVRPIVSIAPESAHVAKAAPGSLLSAYVVATAAGYLLTVNAAAAPASGAVTPVDCLPVPANVATALPEITPAPGETFSTGITLLFSSTGCFTYTPSATAFFHALVQ